MSLTYSCTPAFTQGTYELVTQQEMQSLFPGLFPVLKVNYEHFDVCMALLVSYVLIGGPSFLQVYFGQIAQFLAAVVDDVREEGTLQALKPVDVLSRVCALYFLLIWHRHCSFYILSIRRLRLRQFS